MKMNVVGLVRAKPETWPAACYNIEVSLVCSHMTHRRMERPRVRMIL